MERPKSKFKRGFNLLFVPLETLFAQEKEHPQVDPRSGTRTRESFLAWLEEGYITLQRQAEHWAEVLIVDFTKAIITFDLAVLAFIGAVVNIGTNSTTGIIKNIFAMYAAVSFAVISVLILTIFFWVTVRKNINHSADGVRVIRETLIQHHRGDDGWYSYYQQQMRGRQDDLGGHEFFWFPLHRIGLYLFLGSVLATLLSVLFKSKC